MDIDISIESLIRNDVIEIDNFIYRGIKFSSAFKKQNMTVFDKLFKTSDIRKSELHESEVKDGVLYMKNLILPKNMSLRNFTYMIAFCLDIDITSVIIISDNIPRFRKLQINDYLDNYCLGNSKIAVKISSKKQIKDLGYETIFYNQYINSIYYFSSLNSWKTVIYPTIESISIICLKKDLRINITKLFNVNVVSSDIKKVLVHSSKLDSFMGNYRKMQYVKCPSYVHNGFMNTVSNYETATFYVNMWQSRSTKLVRIEVSENGCIVFRFSIIDTSEYHETITRELQGFIDSEAYKNCLEKIQLKECIYTEEVPHFDYIRIGDITASVVIQGLDGSPFENVAKTISQDIPWMKYKTNSSISIGFFTEASFTSSILYYQALNSHEYITKQIVQKFVMDTVHLLTTKNGLIVTIYDIDSMKEFKWIIELVCGIFKEPSTKQYNYKSDKSIEAIKNKYQNIPSKKLLRTLYDADNIIFGSRKIGDVYRPYSSLAQKDKQRVVIVSKEEYKILEKAQPESCTTVQSQQSHSERLYLFCPFDDYRYLNFRYLTNQVCFPKCTNALTNKTQYKFCSEQLATDSNTSISTKFENKSLTMYNPLLSYGRKCKAPMELTTMLINYYLFKPRLQTSIGQYCLTMFGKEPFIIKRDIKTEMYIVLTDYSTNNDYVLVFQSEADDNYFIVLSNAENKPFVFSENIEFKRFIDSITDNSRIRHSYVNYVNNLLNLKLSPEKPIQDILKEMTVKHKITLVTDGKVIKGIVKNNVFYVTPQIMVNHSRQVYKIANYKLVSTSILKGLIQLPSFKDIPRDYITKILIDYHTNSVCSVIWMNEELLVTPFKEYQDLPYKSEYNDYRGNLIFNVSKDNPKIFNSYRLKEVEVNQILNIWLFIFCSVFQDIDLMKFEEFIRKNIKIDRITKLRYLDNSFYVSWRNSIVSEDDLSAYLQHIKEISQEDMLYGFSDIINDDMVFKYNHIKEVIQTKIITGGAA